MLFSNPEADLPQFSYECAVFIRDYLPRFRSNFAKFCVEAEETPKLPISTELYAEKLYLSMFSHTSMNQALLEQTIRDFVTNTLDAEPVLLKTWMRMINDFVDVLEASSASTPLLMELVHWIDQLSLALYHTYFHISQEVVREEGKWTEERCKQSAHIANGYKQLLVKEHTSDEAPPALMFSCYFRGVEVSFEGTVETVEEGRIICSLEPRHVAVSSRVDHLLLSNPLHGDTMLAEVQHADQKSCQITLHHFEPLAQQADRRSVIRVEPAFPIDVALQDTTGKSVGTIIDLSSNAVSIYLRNTGVDLSEELTLSCELCCDTNSKALELDVPASVSRVRADKRSDPRAHVIVLSLKLDTATRSQLDAYIANRQTEILKEIRHIMEGRA